MRCDKCFYINIALILMLCAGITYMVWNKSANTSGSESSEIQTGLQSNPPLQEINQLDKLIKEKEWNQLDLIASEYESLVIEGTGASKIILRPSNDDRLRFWHEKTADVKTSSGEKELKFALNDASFALLFVPNGWVGTLHLKNHDEVSSTDLIHSGKLDIEHAKKLALVDTMCAGLSAHEISAAQLWGVTGREYLMLTTKGDTTDLVSVNSSNNIKIIHEGSSEISAVSVGAPFILLKNTQGPISYASNEPESSYYVKIVDLNNREHGKNFHSQGDQQKDKNQLELIAPHASVTTHFGDGSCPSSAAQGLDLENCLVPYVK